MAEEEDSAVPDGVGVGCWRGSRGVGRVCFMGGSESSGREAAWLEVEEGSDGLGVSHDSRGRCLTASVGACTPTLMWQCVKGDGKLRCRGHGVGGAPPVRGVRSMTGEASLRSVSALSLLSVWGYSPLGWGSVPLIPPSIPLYYNSTDVHSA